MKAVDFIREFGWEEARDFYYWASKNKSNLAPDDFKLTVLGGYIYYLDLKTYVDAWDLVEKRGGLKEAKKDIIYAKYLGVNDMIFGTSLAELKQAIELVESVNENTVDN